VYQAGVGHKDMKTKFAPFNSLLGHEVGHDGSARLIHEDESVKDFTETHFYDDVELEEVEVVRFAQFITEVVAKRKLPVSAQVITQNVVIKADIEGAELKVRRRTSFFRQIFFTVHCFRSYLTCWWQELLAMWTTFTWSGMERLHTGKAENQEWSLN
jgi:hypothetical protein